MPVLLMQSCSSSPMSYNKIFMKGGAKYNMLSGRIYETLEKYGSGSELKFVVYLAARRDYYGFVRNIDFNEVTNTLGITKSELHYILNRLDRPMVKGQLEYALPNICPCCGGSITEHKHYYACNTEGCKYKIRKDPYDRPRIIEVDRRINKRYWDIQLLNNVFRTYDKKLLESDIAEAGYYIDLSKKFILTPEFMQLPKKPFAAGLLLQNFNKVVDPFQQYEIYQRNFIKWFNTTSLVKFNKSLDYLRPWYTINVNENKKYTVQLKELHHKKDSEEIISFANKTIEVCRSYQRKISVSSAKEIARLIGQYKRKCEEVGEKSSDLLMHVLMKVIKGYRHIEEKIVHKVLSITIKDLRRKIKPQEGAKAPGGKPKFETKQNKPKNQTADSKIASTFNNFKNRKYNNQWLKEYMKITNGLPGKEYFQRRYEQFGITLEMIFNAANGSICKELENIIPGNA